MFNDLSTENNTGCLDWSDVIENDGKTAITLPEGDYTFTVTAFERGRFPGGAKIPACNKANLVLDVAAEEGVAHIRTDLLLHRNVEWKLSGFFRSIGQKQKGERLVMDWSKVVGSRGRAHIIVRSYVDRDGNERTVNDVERYLDYDAEKMASSAIDDYLTSGEDIPF